MLRRMITRRSFASSVPRVNLDKDSNLAALEAQLTPECTKDFWIKGYSVFENVFDQ